MPQAWTPLPWRKITPLHRSLGARSLRYVYPAAALLPLTATPATLNLRYDAVTGIDRIIGFSLAIGPTNTPCNFTLAELNTGWQFGYTYNGSRSIFVLNNIETLPDEVSLQWYFDVDIPAPVYLSFMNVEVVPTLFS